MKPDFTKHPGQLVPAIIQDSRTGNVLMLGYMNEAAYEQTQETGLVTFFSRSRRKLWTKGETSGNYLKAEKILPDCDRDSLLIKAVPSGPVCHTGADTCFGEANEQGDFLRTLEETISQRREQLPEGSYIASLFRKGINKIAQKTGEEAVELIIEAKDENRELFLGEAADLMFHFLILLRARDCSLAMVTEILKERSRH